MEKRQISFSPPDITEAEVSAVADALRSGWITTGPRTKEFEKRIAKLCGTDKAVALGSATACLESILRFLGIGAGDEVITSAYTYTASASPAVHVGAALKFIDVAPDSFEMDYDALKLLLQKRQRLSCRLILQVCLVTMTGFLILWRERRLFSIRQMMCRGQSDV